MTSLDEVMNPDWYAPRRPQARHRAAGRARTGLRARATASLANLAAARQTARDALHDALVGSGTPAGGLALLAGLQQSQRRAS